MTFKEAMGCRQESWLQTFSHLACWAAMESTMRMKACLLYTSPSLDEVYQKCDYITLHLPQTKDTKGMVNGLSLIHI